MANQAYYQVTRSFWWIRFLSVFRVVNSDLNGNSFGFESVEKSVSAWFFSLLSKVIPHRTNHMGCIYVLEGFLYAPDSLWRSSFFPEAASSIPSVKRHS